MIQLIQLTIKPNSIIVLQISNPLSILNMTLCFCCRATGMIVKVDLIKQMLPPICLCDIRGNTQS